jgi:lipoprotein NlpI
MKGWRRFWAWALCGLAVLPGAASVSASPYSDFNAAIAARNFNDCGLAISDFTAALASPDLLPDLRVVALYGRGACYERDRNLTAAIADFTASIALRPAYYDAHLERGKCFAVLKRYGEAEDDFRQLLRIRSDLTDGYAALGALYDIEKRYDAAIAQYSALIRAGTNDYDGYQMRTREYITKGDLDRALSDADKLVELMPEKSTGHDLRSWIYNLRGNYTAALADIETALRLDPTDANQVREKGVLLWKMERYSDSSNTLVALDMRDGYNVLWLDLSRVASGVPDPDLAERAAQVDLRKWPGPLIRLYLGQATPDTVMQAVAADGADNSDRDECEAPFYLGEWQLQHKNKDAARALLRKAAAVCPLDYIERSAAAVELKRLR